MQQKYRCWPERTSTSPSGRHLSHYHALLKPDGSTSADDDYEALDGARKDVWFAHHAILQYSIRHGYCFKRWHQVVNAMIEKEPGDPEPIAFGSFTYTRLTTVYSLAFSSAN